MVNQSSVTGDLKNCIFSDSNMDWFLIDDPKLKLLKTDRQTLGDLWDTNPSLLVVKVTNLNVTECIQLYNSNVMYKF